MWISSQRCPGGPPRKLIGAQSSETGTPLADSYQPAPNHAEQLCGMLHMHH